MVAWRTTVLEKWLRKECLLIAWFNSSGGTNVRSLWVYKTHKVNSRTYDAIKCAESGIFMQNWAINTRHVLCILVLNICISSELYFSKNSSFSSSCFFDNVFCLLSSSFSVNLSFSQAEPMNFCLRSTSSIWNFRGFWVLSWCAKILFQSPNYSRS